MKRILSLCLLFALLTSCGSEIETEAISPVSEIETETVSPVLEYTSQGTPINKTLEADDFPIVIDTPESSCFSSIGYDSDKEILMVTFRDSEATYIYKDVPKAEWLFLRDAKSKGSYFNQNIKGSFECEKLQ